MKLSELLTPRQIEVVALMAQGKLSDGIADKLCITSSCVNYHYRTVKERLRTRTRNQLCAIAVALGDVTPPAALDDYDDSMLSPADHGIMRMLCAGMKITEVAAATGVGVSCIMTFRLDEIRDHMHTRNTIQSVCMYAAAHPDDVLALNCGTLRGLFEHPRLSERQLAVAKLLARGVMEKNIADALGIDVSTVKFHAREMKAKLCAATIFQACAILAYERRIPVPPRNPDMPSLTAREIVVMDALCSGWRVNALYGALRRSSTVMKSGILTRIYRKLGTYRDDGTNRTVQAVVIYAAHYWRPIKAFGDSIE